MGVHPQRAVLEVHEQEGDVVEHVDARHLVAELDAVEQGGPAVDETDVSEMQVAMATTNESLRAASHQPIGLTLERLMRQGETLFDFDDYSAHIAEVSIGYRFQ